MLKVTEMVVEKNCKHVVKYKAIGDNPAISNVYVEKTAFPDGMPDKLFIAVSEDPISTDDRKDKKGK